MCPVIRGTICKIYYDKVSLRIIRRAHVNFFAAHLLFDVITEQINDEMMKLRQL